MQENTTNHYRRIMVIDDNSIDRYVAEKVMKKYRFAEEVICIESAPEALEYLKSCADNHVELPQIIFLDINMPEMNGFEFLQEYASLADNIKKHCIIMMLTTSLNEEDRVSAENNPYVHQFLNKPLSEDKLKEITMPET